MSDFSTPPWKEKEQDLCEECGGIIRDGFCDDCGARQQDEELNDYEYLNEER